MRPEGLRIIDGPTIRTLATPDLVIASVRAGLIAHAGGEIISPPPGHLGFIDPPGDCHIKFGRSRTEPIFVIKVATGFYNNPARGLPSSNGLMLILSAETGAPLALLNDEGWLTDARTAAAGVLALEGAKSEEQTVLGILGAGVQAELQARWITRHRGFERVAIWARNPIAAERLAATLNAEGIDALTFASPAEVAQEASVIVTCTPSREPLLQAIDVGPKHLIIAVGADVEGKRELDPAIIDQADWIICDDVERCLSHGEIQGRSLEARRLAVLGQRLKSGNRPLSGLIIVDLTGLPAQDIFVAAKVYDALMQ